MSEAAAPVTARAMFRKTALIEAVRWMNEDNDLLCEVGNDNAARFLGSYYAGIDGDRIIIHTLEGDHAANRGDWLAKGIKGECWPIKADIFAATYERVEGRASTSETAR